jgi:hypothetical protein
MQLQLMYQITSRLLSNVLLFKLMKRNPVSRLRTSDSGLLSPNLKNGKTMHLEQKIIRPLAQLLRPLARSGIFFIFVLSGLSLHAQNKHDKTMHRNYKEAINLLQQGKASLPSDSLLFQNELKKVKTDYKAFADSLKMDVSDSVFASFETQRFITLCYVAQSIHELKHQQNNLFEHLATYHTHIPNQDSINEEIAKCLVNSYESQSIWFEDSVLYHVTSAIEQHMQSLQSWTWLPAQKQAFVDMYASQYYKRGIISLAEPVFRHFRDVFNQEKKADTTAVKWSIDYPVLSAKLAPTEKKLSDIHGKKIGIIATSESPFHLIYLIVQLRTADRAYPDTPVCVFRNPSTVSDDYLHAMKRNLAIDDYYIVNLNEADSKTAKQFPCCYCQSDKGDMVFSTNNPIDFLEWLEKPLKSQMKAKKEQLHANYKKNQARKDSITSLPPDTTIKHTISSGNLTVHFRGYWNKKPEIKIKWYRFTESSYKKLSDERQLASLEVYLEQHPIYNLDFFPREKQIEISLTAGPRHHIRATFEDDVNQHWHTMSQQIDSLTQTMSVYRLIEDKYPFQKSEFMQRIYDLKKDMQTRITKVSENAGKAEQALLEIKQNVTQLQASLPDTSIQYEDLKAHFPVQSFDSVIWNSPYYQAWVDGWLTYASQDLKTAVDLMYGAWQIIPDTAGTSVGKYLWDKMNSMGRVDIMVYLDTTWLSGCYDIKDGDMMKRVKGYKRMTPGKKAPNITWQENGAEMDLYSIEADTTIVVFWSDECTHCMKTLPFMYAKLSSRKDIEVIAIATG